ncbi:MAG: Mini-ribonuclease 3 [Oscillospiraceae bacterium]|jgi:ribonuclease-3 family protein
MDYFQLQLDRTALLGMSNLALAHLGDAVYELMVRSRLCVEGVPTSKKLHQATVSYVAAPAQAKAAARILPLLTEEEADVFRRGRNAHFATVPQHATREEYRTATAVEALFGWLYLQGRRDRLCTLFDQMMGEGEEKGAAQCP